MKVQQHRGGLTRTLAAIGRGELRVGFIGGSITQWAGGCNWPEPVLGWITENFPGVRVAVENAGIGATGSDLAVFRAQRELLDRGCDLVFAEYAVNDCGEPAVRRGRTREGLLRKLKAAGCDVVVVYTFIQDFYEPMMAGRVPASIADFEKLAEHYEAGSVWMSLHALNEVRTGRMRWEDWLPDGLHPQHRGSLSYAQSVMAYLERELKGGKAGKGSVKGRMPAPLDAMNWQSATVLPWERVKTQGPWTLRRSQYHWAEQILDTAAVGAKLSFEFEGRGLALAFDFGKRSSEFVYRLDGGVPAVSNRDRPGWCGDSGWMRLFIVGDDLPAGRHRFELEVVHGNRGDCGGTNCRLALVGVIE